MNQRIFSYVLFILLNVSVLRGEFQHLETYFLFLVPEYTLCLRREDEWQ